ncbi:YndM family protein [Virgibacillus sp. C22-A2]|uniref:YndM family protein n=1 Tax=Virgibacillus tibetensis TaxID=3042313 RepID=A0ABU6KLD6_9BACI|nr:YndM family protein [Virgibacillus sp. C22-A2]
MGHLKVLGIKFLVISFTIFAILGIFTFFTSTDLLLISFLVTGLAYLIGDLFILRKFGNMTATIADFPLAFLSLWIAGGLFGGGDYPVITTSLLAAFFITACEPFIHGYIVNQFSAYSRKDHRKVNQLQTEFAEETDGQKIFDGKAYSEKKGR